MSALFAYTILKHPSRLREEVEKAVHKIMPHRIAFFRELFTKEVAPMPE